MLGGFRALIATEKHTEQIHGILIYSAYCIQLITYAVSFCNVQEFRFLIFKSLADMRLKYDYLYKLIIHRVVN